MLLSADARLGFFHFLALGDFVHHNQPSVSLSHDKNKNRHSSSGCDFLDKNQNAGCIFVVVVRKRFRGLHVFSCLE